MNLKVTDEQAAEIRRRFKEGRGVRGLQARLAREYGIRPSGVWKIVHGETYGERQTPGPKPRLVDPRGRNCTRCGGFKPWGSFSPDKRGVNRRHSICKPCIVAHRSTEEQRRVQADDRLRRNFGITLAQFEEAWKRQGEVCALCGKPERCVRLGAVSRPHVDHDHSCCPGVRTCGKCLRGLLCNKCNRLVGRIEAAGFTLDKLAAYQQQRMFENAA